MKKIFRITAGVLLCLIGLINLLIPVVPTSPFLIPGLLMLAEYFPWARRLVDWAKAKFEGATGRTGGEDPNLPK